MAAEGTVVATSGSVAKKRYWVKVREGSAVAYHLDDETVVSELLQQVQTKEKLAVGVGKMKLYQSEELFKKGEALNPMLPVLENQKDANGMAIPFYVDYHVGAAWSDVGGTFWGEGSNLIQMMKLMTTELKPVVQDFKARRMRELDPWAALSHTTPQDNSFKRSLIDYYKCKGESGTVFCQVLQVPLPSADVAASHIWPRKTRGTGLEDFGLPAAHINEPRNGLLLAKAIEVAFDSQQVCFVYDFVHGNFACSVVDNSIKSNRVHGQCRFKHIHGKELWTNGGESLPYRRLLSWHAARTFQRHGRLDLFKKYERLSEEACGFKFPEDCALATFINAGMEASNKEEDD